MKKIIVSVLVVIGIYSVLLFGYKFLFSRAGTTMYAGAPAVYKTMDNAVPGSAAMSTEKPAQVQSEQVMRRMIIRNAQLSLQVNDIPKALDEITQIADHSGGYVVNSELNQNVSYGGGEYAKISIRVPANGLNSVLSSLKVLAIKVVQETVTGEDITQQYVNLESELNNLKTTKAQLAKIMQGATKTEDVLLVFQQLSETQRKIDLTEGQIKYYKESVAYSLITIDLSMNPEIQITQDSKWQITEVISESYQELIKTLRQFTYGMIEFFIFFVPLMLLWAVIVLILFLIGRALYKKFR
ncbi:DUF4349 domain-containing protein [Legionella bononiensis]|uniref:DUF4349 domain-containing protein n=1 Tax=Legionella bononiensis TaxID=2793102 RepID=A0ABS1W6I3_9GAMM|nr:DUF4349 domain-containing protein [Legionella bononiensis]MBL7478377.1 DUF4349 domain-containing protein [Legionella bononiensis]MBL7524974.1 DUF4349 domain-containing protein [Legionella bononiensis]MBL7561271.1 DUF4349 domain-containing protein [Legionella bononiensis]